MVGALAQPVPGELHACQQLAARQATADTLDAAASTRSTAQFNKNSIVQQLSWGQQQEVFQASYIKKNGNWHLRNKTKRMNILRYKMAWYSFEYSF